MTTSTSSWLENILDNLTSTDDYVSLVSNDPSTDRNNFFVLLFKWILRIACVVTFFLCPWSNFKLIQFFQTRPFYNQSSAKWYIIFKAIFDTIYVLISVPLVFFLTFGVDVIHQNVFTCTILIYIHYFSDDLISNMLALLCFDRIARITCNYRIRERFSLSVCSAATGLFLLINFHHIVRLRHTDGFCHKIYISIGDYDFDIYYSLFYTLLTWTIIFIGLINLSVSIYCDRTRRLKLNQQKEQIVRKLFNGNGGVMGNDSDRLELIHSSDDWEVQDSTVVTIEQSPTNENGFVERERQDIADLHISVCVLITSGVFLLCNIPNFIIFVSRYMFDSHFNTAGYIFVYLSLYLLFFAHTISYYIYNHLAARLFPNNLS